MGAVVAIGRTVPFCLLNQLAWLLGDEDSVTLLSSCLDCPRIWRTVRVPAGEGRTGQRPLVHHHGRASEEANGILQLPKKRKTRAGLSPSGTPCVWKARGRLAPG